MPEPFKKEVVVTGGPCAGKTTFLPYAKEKLMDRGIRTFLVPEVPTIVIAGGVHDIAKLAEKSADRFFEVEKQMFMMQMSLREHFNSLANIFNNEPRVILYDRAEMDILSYVPREVVQELLKRAEFGMAELRDRYDAVVHLVTAAYGAEQFYGNQTNQARSEGIKEARSAEQKTLHSWIGHPHLKIIDNSTDFEHKLKRALQSLFHVIGMPAPLEIEKKFLLRNPPDFSIPELANCQKIYIEQMYLMKQDGESRIRIRKRGQHGSFLYYKTQKKKVAPGVRHEVESMISAKDYEQFKAFRDPNRSPIIKYRHCFVYRSQYFELDVFRYPNPELCLLEIELTEENDKVELPPFLSIAREVTNDPDYSNSELAKIK